MKNLSVRLAATVLAIALNALPLFAVGEVVDLNTATVAELRTLPGIGAAKAQAIIDFRSEHGRFESVDHLRHVRGIGEKLLVDLRPQVTVGAGEPNSKQ